MVAERQETGMPWAEVLALPPVIDLDTANRALLLGRSLGYDLARKGSYPCDSWRAGSTHRVSTTALWSLLGVDPAEVLARAAEAPATAPVPCPSCGHEDTRAPMTPVVHLDFGQVDSTGPQASAA